MTLTDPVANLLTSIRNAAHARKETVDVPASKLTGRILEIFKGDGYIEDFRLMKDSSQGTYKIYLKHKDNKKKIITGIQKISRPGRKRYVKADSVPRVLNGLGTAVISTSRGVLNDREARKQKVGGEVLCYIW